MFSFLLGGLFFCIVCREIDGLVPMIFVAKCGGTGRVRLCPFEGTRIGLSLGSSSMSTVPTSRPHLRLFLWAAASQKVTGVFRSSFHCESLGLDLSAASCLHRGVKGSKAAVTTPTRATPSSYLFPLFFGQGFTHKEEVAESRRQREKSLEWRKGCLVFGM